MRIEERKGIGPVLEMSLMLLSFLCVGVGGAFFLVLFNTTPMLSAEDV